MAKRPLDSEWFVKQIKNFKSVILDKTYAPISQVGKDTLTTQKQTITGAINELNDGSKEKINAVTKGERIEFSNGYNYYATAVDESTMVDQVSDELVDASSTTYSGIKITCSPGEYFTINGKGGTIPRLWCFTDADRHPLTYAPEQLRLNFGVISAPKNAKYLYVNTERIETDARVYRGVVNERTATNLLEYDVPFSQQFTTGKYINLSEETFDEPKGDSGFNSMVLHCYPGEKFTMRGTGGGPYALLYAWADKDKKILERAETNTTFSEYTLLTAPSNAKYLVINCRKGSGYISSVFRGIYLVKDNLFEDETKIINAGWISLESKSISAQSTADWSIVSKVTIPYGYTCIGGTIVNTENFNGSIIPVYVSSTPTVRLINTSSSTTTLNSNARANIVLFLKKS